MDTFHTGTATMWSRGTVREDNVISVIGRYAAGTEPWGWRTQLTRTTAGLALRAFNITPGGEEQRAIETDWIPGRPGAIDDLNAQGTARASGPAHTR